MDGRRRGPKMATSEGGHEGVHTLNIGYLRRILDIFEDSWPPSKMSEFLRVAIFEATFGHFRQLPNPATAEAVFDWHNPKLCLRAAHGAPGEARVGRCLFQVLYRARLACQFFAQKLHSFTHGGSSLVGRHSDGFVGGGGDGGAVPDNVRRENFIADESLFEAKAEAGRERPE